MNATKKWILASAKKRGLFNVGAFMFGARSDDIVSGIAFDGTPSASYVWTFILPTFDEASFLHMTLGRRLGEIESNEGMLDNFIQSYVAELGSIRTASQLYEYLDDHHIIGDYSIWVRYLCLIRSGDADKSEAYLSTIEQAKKTPSIERKFAAILSARRSGGLPAMQEMLEIWSAETAELIARVPPSLSPIPSRLH